MSKKQSQNFNDIENNVYRNIMKMAAIDASRKLNENRNCFQSFPTPPILFNGDIIEFYKDYMKRLWKDYHKVLRKKGITKKRSTLLKTENIIDFTDITGTMGLEEISAIMPAGMTDKEIIELADDLDWLIALPIFNTGVFIVDKNSFIKFTVKDINFQKQTCLALIEYYGTIIDEWSLRLSMTISYHPEHQADKQNIDISESFINFLTPDKILTECMNAKELSWTGKEKNLYMEIVNPLIDQIMNSASTLPFVNAKLMEQDEPIPAVIQVIGKTFLQLCMRTNVELYLHQHGKKIKSTQNSKAVSLNESIGNKPIQHIRNIVIASNEEIKVKEVKQL